MSRTVTAFAPGRVNLLGEHTDYNGGLSLPFAIEQGVEVRATALDGDEIEAVAHDLGERDRFDAAAPPPTAGWRAFVRGVVAELRADRLPAPPARLEISATLERGAGLSSSAALEVALCLALLGLAGVERPDSLRLARICSRAENAWAGAHTGLLDQLASLEGRAGHALRIDFCELSVEPVALDLGDWRLVTVDSGERHSNAAGGYDERRAECAAACERLGAGSLSEADPRAAAALPDPLNRHARHVLDENDRVDRAAAALHAGDMEQLARLLDASHASLRDLYDASTPAVDRAVVAVRAAGAAGARMVGGGVGGHVLALLPPDVPPPPGSTVVAPAAGARLIDG